MQEFVSTNCDHEEKNSVSKSIKKLGDGCGMLHKECDAKLVCDL